MSRLGSRASGTDIPASTPHLTARSPLGLRLLLSAVFAPLYVVGAVLFATWAASAGPDDSPSAGALRVAAGICAALAVLAVMDLVVVLRRRGRERGSDR